MNIKLTKTSWTTYLLLFIGAVLILFPFYWMMVTSLKDLGETLQVPPTFIPETPTLENFDSVVTELPFIRLILNTVIVIVFVVVGTIVICSMAAFALSIIKVPAAGFLLMTMLAISMVPGEIFIIPVYVLFSNAGITNTLSALILPDVLNVIGVLLMYQAFNGVPKSYIEAARIDGSSWFSIYSKIMMPLAKPAITSLAIIAALGSWKQVLWPIIVNSDLEKMPIGPGLAQLQGMYFTQYNLIMAANLLATIPIIIIFLVLQKQFMDSMTTTGEK